MNYAEAERILKRAVLVPGEMREIMIRHDIVIDDLDDKMQKFAFTLYTELCSLGSDAEAALEVPDELK